MPLKPVHGKLQMPVETKADVEALFERGLSLVRHQGAWTREHYRRDLADYFYYIGAVCPENFASLQEQASCLSDEHLQDFSFTFDIWLYLMRGAPDVCVENLLTRLSGTRQNQDRRQMIAAVLTSAAFAAMAGLSEQEPTIRTEYNQLGFFLPGNGRAAVPRFTTWRNAISKVDFPGSRAELFQERNPVGLAVSQIAQDNEQTITWHYLTLGLAGIEGLPAAPFERLHLVSPAVNCGWTLFSSVGQDDRYHSELLDQDDDEDYAEQLHIDEKRDAEGWGVAELLPYDDRLTYRNGHTIWSDAIVGDAGGPPIGLYPNPNCPGCNMLMFHVCTVESGIREYGDGFRSLFFCEQCGKAACQGTSWN